MGHININSLRNKFDFLKEIICDNIDILLVSETKLDSSFPHAQFQIDGYSKPYRLDRNGKGGGMMLYVRNDIPSKCLSKSVTINNKEYLIIEINLRKRKWLLICNYNPHKHFIKEHLDHLSKEIDYFISNYDNIIIIGDFNYEPSEDLMKNFCQSHNLRSLLNEPTCFKNPDKPSCIDLILTNKPKCFENSCTFDTGLSDLLYLY